MPQLTSPQKPILMSSKHTKTNPADSSTRYFDRAYTIYAIQLIEKTTYSMQLILYIIIMEYCFTTSVFLYKIKAEVNVPD